MAKPQRKIQEIVALIEKHGPVSPNRLTELTGDFRQSVDKYIRLAHSAGMIHVDSFGPSPLGGNRKVKLYAHGKGVDAARVLVRERPAAKKPEPESRRGKNFSPAEKKILREIKWSGKTVKSQLHRLPGRTLYGVQRAVSHLRGTKKRGFSSWIWTAIVLTLKETPDLTSIELAEAIGCTSRQVVHLLKENHAEKNRSVYISSWAPRNGTPTRRWSLGAGEDAPRPKPQGIEQERHRARARHHMRRAEANPFAATVNQLRAAA
jgi:hypothetical protein